jgi:Tfp pilus assembly protein PilP
VSGRGRRGGLGGGGNGPDMRRILPVVGVVVLVLVLGFVVLGSCGGSSKADAYRTYVQDVNSVARQSNTDAKALDAALYNQELTPDQVITKVGSFIPKARATETTASALKPTGKIKQQDLQRFLLQALQYRTLGLQDLQAALKKALIGKKAAVPATAAQREEVANAYKELMASDVVYAASFQRPAQAILSQENVTDAALVPSPWGLSPELANPDPNSNGLWIQSVRDAGQAKPCTGGSIGTSIDGVTANGKALTAGTAVTTVKLTIPSTFKVTVGNHGNCPVRGISIHLTEGNSKTQNIPVKSLLPSETVERSFPATGNPGEVKVDVSVPTVAGETNADNNHYTYHVVFQSA